MRAGTASTSTTEVIGKLPEPTMPLNPRTRQVYDEPKWTGYEVMLDVYPDVFAYGILLVPKDLKPGEKRPVVVCQHGLEGRPRTSSTRRSGRRTTTRSAPQLADQGYIVYAPQNPYIGENTSASLQRKANPLKLSLFSLHHPPARADARLARDAAVRRPEADRLLRPVLRRQDGHARAGRREAVLPVDLLGRLQRVDRQERVGRPATAATCGPASTRCTSSTWATRSTTRRWRT